MPDFLIRLDTLLCPTCYMHVMPQPSERQPLFWQCGICERFKNGQTVVWRKTSLTRLFYTTRSSLTRIKAFALVSKPNVVCFEESDPSGTMSFSFSKQKRRWALLSCIQQVVGYKQTILFIKDGPLTSYGYASCNHWATLQLLHTVQRKPNYPNVLTLKLVQQRFKSCYIYRCILPTGCLATNCQTWGHWPKEWKSIIAIQLVSCQDQKQALVTSNHCLGRAGGANQHSISYIIPWGLGLAAA